MKQFGFLDRNDGDSDSIFVDMMDGSYLFKFQLLDPEYNEGKKAIVKFKLDGKGYNSSE